MLSQFDRPSNKKALKHLIKSQDVAPVEPILRAFCGGPCPGISSLQSLPLIKTYRPIVRVPEHLAGGERISGDRGANLDRHWKSIG